MTTTLKDKLIWWMRHRPGQIVFGICLGAAILGTYFKYTHRNEWANVIRELPRDDRTLVLSSDEIEALAKSERIHPVKSRGSTIFMDDNDRVRIPPSNIIDKMYFRDLVELYHRYIESIQVACKNTIHIGAMSKGGSDICMDKNVKPPENCLAYNFGLNKDFSFDDDLAGTLGCEVHSFCPRKGAKSHQRSENVYFHAMGVADYDGVSQEKWEMRRVQTLKRELGHRSRTLDILRIKVEGGEWTSLPEIISSGILDEIKQVIVEFSHLLDKYPRGFDHRTVEHFKMYLNIFKLIFEKGFRIYMFGRNTGKACLYSDALGNARTGCHEVHFMKIYGS